MTDMQARLDAGPTAHQVRHWSYDMAFETCKNEMLETANRMEAANGE